MHSICVRTVTWAKLTDSCNIVASVHMQTCHPVRAPFLQACQPAVPNPLIFTLLQPLFFSPIKLLSHTHCSSHPSSCCPTPTVLLTHQAVVPHQLFSPIKLLSNTHSSHPSSCCPTPTVLLTHQAVVKHPLFFSPIKLLSNTHCSSHPSSCCPTATVPLAHQAAVPHPLFFLPIKLLSHTCEISHLQAAVPHTLFTPINPLSYCHSWITLSPAPHHSELLCLIYLQPGGFLFLFWNVCTHAQTHTQSLVPSAELCVHTVRKVDNCRWSLSHIWCNTGIKSDDYH